MADVLEYHPCNHTRYRDRIIRQIRIILLILHHQVPCSATVTCCIQRFALFGSFGIPGSHQPAILRGVEIDGRNSVRIRKRRDLPAASPICCTQYHRFCKPGGAADNPAIAGIGEQYVFSIDRVG
ncbi:hypothetical protein D3C73_1197060 [compost metagenome]